MRLPEFKVASNMVSADIIRDIRRRIFPREDHKINELVTKVELKSKIGRAEVDVGKDGVWASDKTRCWKCEPTID